MQEPVTYKFRSREIILIFLLLLVGGAVLFSLGIKVGQNVLCKNAAPKEEVKLNNVYSASENYDDNKLQQKTEKPAVAPEEKPEVKNEEVKPEALPEASLVIREITSDIKGKYTIQISSHQGEDEAKKIAGELYKSGYKLAYYMEADVPGKGTWYRVGIGFFKQKSSAETFAEMLKKQGKIAGYLIRKID
jgi:cell division septation protein DedD